MILIKYQLSDEDFMISALRHKFDALSIKILAMNFETGEEFILDMS